MATTTYDYLSTRNQLCERALRIVGTGVPPGEAIPADQLLGAVEALNEIVKELQNDHIFLWSVKTLLQTLASSTASYSLASTDPKVLWIENAYIRQSNVDTPLQQINYAEYLDIANKTQSGVPTHFCTDGNRDPTLYVWPVPTSALSLYMTAVTSLEDWESSTGTADFPARFKRALIYTLAADLCDDYNIPEGRANRIEGKAQALMLRAKASDRNRARLQQMNSAYCTRK